MKKIVKYLSLILIFLLSANMLCACKHKPWTYTDSIWYSEEPSIQIYKEDDGKWYIDIANNSGTEKYLFVWSGTMGVSIYPLNIDEYSSKTRLFLGKINTNRSRRLVLYVREDKIWNNEYTVITLHRRPIRS